jgi:hypothetical protein
MSDQWTVTVPGVGQCSLARLVRDRVLDPVQVVGLVAGIGPDDAAEGAVAR